MTERIRKAPRQAEADRNDRALLDAAQEVLAVDGPHASVAAIAARAGVGIGSLYRRYRTKDDLFQRLCVVALDRWIEAAEEGLAHANPWEGLAHYVTACVASRAGSLAPLAGAIAVTDEMLAKFKTSDAVTDALLARAHAAGVLRSDVTSLDITALIVQLSKRDQLEPTAAERNARTRVIAIALDGLRAGQGGPLPGYPPGDDLFAERWSQQPMDTES